MASDLRKGRHKMAVNATALSEMVSLLGRGEYSKEQLVLEVGVAIGTIIKWINLGRRKHRRLYHISRYVQGSRGSPTAMWSYGPDEPDAPRPKPMTQRQYNERARIKKVLKSRGSISGMAQMLKQAAKGDAPS